jgi:hypothetical protein
MLEALFEILAEFLGEFLLQLVVEGLFELGLRSLAAPFRRRPNPWLAALGYTLFGGLGGAFSLLAFPSHLISSRALRVANLAITPVAVGLLMCAMGVWRARRGQPVLRIDRFAYGYLFAISLALLRFYYAY